MDNLKVGDVVVLKTGGIKMVVNHIDGDRVEATWLDAKTQKPEFAEFNKAVLKIFEEPAEPRSTSVPVVTTW